MNNNKTQVINFRVSEEKKQEILKLSYELDISITELMLQSYENYKKYCLENMDILNDLDISIFE